MRAPVPGSSPTGRLPTAVRWMCGGKRSYTLETTWPRTRRRRALRRRGEPALLRVDGARRAGVGDFDLPGARARLCRGAPRRDACRPRSGGCVGESDRIRSSRRGPGRDGALAGRRRRTRRAPAGRAHRAGPSHLYRVRARGHRGRVSCSARRPGPHAVPLPRSTLGAARVTTAARTIEHVTCLGCGCACDDITVVVERGRLTEAQQACGRGAAWFGDGQVPDEIRIRDRTGTMERAIAEAAKLLADAKRPLVYLAGDISCEGHRDAVAIADRLKGA